MKRIAIPLTLAAIVAATYVNDTNTPVDESTHIGINFTRDIVDDSISTYYNKVTSPIKFAPACTGGAATFEIDGIKHTGIINVVQTDVDGQVRIGGDFSRGTFCFAVQPDSTTTGLIIVPSTNKCYTMNPTMVDEPITWEIRKISEIMCVDMPAAEGGAIDSPSTSPVTTQAAVPILNSKPNATTVLFLDFVGGKIQDPLWNGGRTIDATPAYYSAQQIQTTFDVVTERYSMFNINVTTDLQAYLKAPIKNRMRIVLTNTNFIKGYSGYAYIGSLARAGTGVFAPNVVCWAFVNMVSSAKSAGEICAHELGHTFGLSHDGTNSSAYYSGQGRWASVMGYSFSRPVVQWSKGEYNNANNTQDDVGIIARTPRVGYHASPTTTTQTGSINTTNIISKPTDVHQHTLTVTRGGSLVLQAIPAPYSGVDVMLELRDSKFNTIAFNNNLNRSDAFITWPVNTGTYHILVRPTGDGNPRTTGYSVYGSLGKYVLTGTVR